MPSGPGAGAERWLRRRFPAALTFALLVLGLVPVPVAGFGVAAPVLVLVSVYYWSVWRPDLLPVHVVFAVGLLQDLLLGMPAGVTALVLLLVHATIVGQRRFLAGKPFWILWFGFVLTAPPAVLAVWLAAMAVGGAWLPTGGVVFQILVALLAFPLLSWMLLRAQRRVLAAD